MHSLVSILAFWDRYHLLLTRNGQDFVNNTHMHRLIHAQIVNNLLHVQKWLSTDTIDRSISSVDNESTIHRLVLIRKEEIFCLDAARIKMSKIFSESNEIRKIPFLCPRDDS